MKQIHFVRTGHNPGKSHTIYAVSDGRISVGYVEHDGRVYVAVDTDGIVVGEFVSLVDAVRSLPGAEAAA
jgi:hypothetical protein